MKTTKVTGIALASVLALAVVGCGSSATTPAPASAGASASTAAQGSTYTAASVTNPNNPAEVSDKLVPEATPDAVLAQHMKALNGCDWKGLMQQYPDSYEMLSNGTLVKGRTQAAATFAGFVKPQKDGGLCGLTFTEKSRQVVGNTIAVQWEANAPFLAAPYSGSDAYITDGGFMVSMVTTFDGNALKYKK